MTLLEIKATLNQIPDDQLEIEAKFLNGADIDWDGVDTPQIPTIVAAVEIPDLPTVHSWEENQLTIDGITRVYDSDSDAAVWVFHD